jgi:hypothetical protein
VYGNHRYDHVPVVQIRVLCQVIYGIGRHDFQAREARSFDRGGIAFYNYDGRTWEVGSDSLQSDASEMPVPGDKVPHLKFSL